MPKGRLDLVQASRFLKLINVPCAVSGLRYATLPPAAPMFEDSIRLKTFASLNSPLHFGHFNLFFCMISVSSSGVIPSTNSPLSSSIRLSALYNVPHFFHSFNR